MQARRRKLIFAALALTLPALATAQPAPQNQAAAPAEPAAPVAAPAAEGRPAEARPAETKPAELKLTPYGFVLMAAFFDDTKFGTSQTAVTEDYPSMVQGGPGAIFATARQSRFGVRVDFPEALGATLKGVLEADFKGGYTSTANTTANAPNPRLRIAWGTATWRTDFGSIGLGAGQEYGLVAPVFGVSSAWVADPVFYYSGNLWRRASQLRLFGDVGLPSGLGLTWAVAGLDPIENVATCTSSTACAPDFGPGNLARVPDIEGRIAVSYKMEKKTVAEVGIGAQGGKERYYGTTTIEVNKRLVALDGQLNLPYLSVRGEWFTGQNLDSYWGAFGGSGVVLTTAGTPAVITDAKAIRETGGWVQAILQPMGMSNLVQLTIGFGIDDPSDRDLEPAPGRTPPTDITKNEMLPVGLIVNPSKNWRAGVEWAHVMTKKGRSTFIGNQIAFSTAYTF